MERLTQIELCNCFAARQAARRLTRLYEQHLAAAGLTSAQFSILVCLQEAAALCMADLASALVMDRTTLLRAIRPLQRESLVVSRPAQDDARRLLLALAPAGQRRLKKALALWSDAQQAFEARVGAQEAARLRRELFAVARMA